MAPALDRTALRRWLGGYLLASIAVLLLGVVAGYAVGTQLPGLPMAAEPTASPFVPAELTVVSIAVNNLLAMVIILLGAVSLGITTAVVLFFNGLVIGLVLEIALRELPPATVFWLVAPHGVLEIPAILIVSAIGFRLGHKTVRYVRGRESQLVTERELREAGALILVSALLIVVAAWIEANVTLRLAEQF